MFALDVTTTLPVAVPAGGIVAVFVFLVRLWWTDNSARGRVEALLREEFAAALARERQNNDANMATLRKLHAEEVEFLQRRIGWLEREVQKLRAKG